MGENSLQTGSAVKRTKSFKDKILDYHGTVKGQIERTKSLFMDARQMEEARKTNLIATQKLMEFRQKQRDYRLAIDHLSAEYVSSKESSFIMRYGKMKLMVKRILMQEKELSKTTATPELPEGLTDTKGTPANGRSANGGTESSQQNGGSASTPVDVSLSKLHKDVAAKVQKLESMSRQEILDDATKMDEEAAEIACKLSQVRGAIHRLEDEYAEAKQFAPWDRYIMMKKMIKQFLTCKNALSNM